MSENNCKKRKRSCSFDYSDYCCQNQPETTYSVNICNKILSLSLTAKTVIKLGVLRIYYTITNTGTTSIKSPIYIFDDFTGTHKVTCKKLKAGDDITYLVKKKLKCFSDNVCTQEDNTECMFVVKKVFQYDAVAPFSANAFTNIVKDCLILLSPPILITV